VALEHAKELARRYMPGMGMMGGLGMRMGD
jgi:hypothetical protein